MKTTDIRKKFLEFFEEKNHQVVESSPLVPRNDPTLLFTNAGMVQFKDVFLGREKRSYNRATSSQKCVRAGGKHNDLENVGFTARHHTFFEMLGNFSFGDYFKSEAIAYAWEFSTKVLKLPKDKLYVTVFEDDDEAAEIWHKEQGVPKDRIYRFGAADNFWQMGDTGPCGPCSELFIDRGRKYCDKTKDGDPDCQMGCDCDRYMEFWNLVFMQYDRDSKGTLNPLPKPSVDTGAGLERLASILQNADTNYDIDVFKSIMIKTGELAGTTYDPTKANALSFRVIADHARCAAFLVGDGVLASNEGRGYVLRRIIRRAVRYGKKLGLEKPFLHKVCGFVIDQMGDIYPELKEQRTLIDRCILAEEEQFLKTLEKGLLLLDGEMSSLKKSQKLSGATAFKLYDTFGFPIDLTRVICREHGIDVDEPGFEQAMAEQKSRSRENWKGSGEVAVSSNYQDLYEKLKAEGELPEFVGYNSLHQQGTCLAVFPGSGNKVEAIFDKTPFYGESGGQVGDKGKVSGEGFEANVLDTKKPYPDLIVLKLEVTKGSLAAGQSVVQEVDERLRRLAERNHTGTHLLHWALGKVLGDHVKQAGSLVTPDVLRFDFSHFEAVTKAELDEVEEIINQKIWQADPVGCRVMAKDDAVKAGAVAMFGEKYGDEVRVINVGEYSVELCGGTHVKSSSEINVFKIVSEGGVAAGVRRIVAATSEGAYRYLQERYSESSFVRSHLKANSLEDLEARFTKIDETEKDLRQQLGRFESLQVGKVLDELIAKAKPYKTGRAIVATCDPDAQGIKKLRDIAERLCQKAADAIVVLAMSDPGSEKAFVLAAKGKDADKGFHAGDLIKILAPLIDGRGGGRPEMAQAGGTKAAGMSEMVSKAEGFLGL